MKKGSAIGVSDIIIFILFVLLVLAFFAVMKWDRTEKPNPEPAEVAKEGFVLISYLRSPINVDIDGKPGADAKTVMDLVVLAHTNENAAAALEAEFEEVRSILESMGQVSAFRALYPDTVYKSERYIQTSNMEGIPLETNLLRGKSVVLPLPDGKEVEVYYDIITSDEEKSYETLSKDMGVKGE